MCLLRLVASMSPRLKFVSGCHPRRIDPSMPRSSGSWRRSPRGDSPCRVTSGPARFASNSTFHDHPGWNSGARAYPQVTLRQRRRPQPDSAIAATSEARQVTGTPPVEACHERAAPILFTRELASAVLDVAITQISSTHARDVFELWRNAAQLSGDYIE